VVVGRGNGEEEGYLTGKEPWRRRRTGDGEEGGGRRVRVRVRVRGLAGSVGSGMVRDEGIPGAVGSGRVGFAIVTSPRVCATPCALERSL
jgi:hypothetical protein